MGVTRSNNYGVEKYSNKRKVGIWLTLTDDASTPAVAINTTLTDPDLIGQVEVVSSATTGVLVTEQTFTGVDLGAAAGVIGIGVLDGNAKSVSGYMTILSNTGAANVAVATVGGGKVGGISGQTIPGVSSSGNVACLITLIGATPVLDAATGTGLAYLELVIG